MRDKYKILVLNQDEELLDAIKEIQLMGPYNIEVTHSASQTFEKIKNDKYHIVLLDIDIDDKNGIDLLKEIKDYDPLTQIIMTTRHSTMDKILASLEHGANGYMVEPFTNPEEVTKIINDSIDKLERWRKSILDLVLK